MCPNELVYAVTTLAAAIAKDRTADEINILGAIFTQLGDTLATMSVQQSICENASSDN